MTRKGSKEISDLPSHLTDRKGRPAGNPVPLLPSKQSDIGQDAEAFPEEKPVDRPQGEAGDHQVIDQDNPLSRTSGEPFGFQAKMGRKEGLPPFRTAPVLLGGLRRPHNSGK